MKNKIIIAGLILMAAVMLSSLSNAIAAGNFTPGVLFAANRGSVWYTDLKPLYTGKDVDLTVAVVAKYWITGTETEPYVVVPDRVSIADSQIKVFFDTTTLPDSAAKNTLIVTMLDDTEFVAAGEGWAMGGHF
jgi:hypothetical protein